MSYTTKLLQQLAEEGFTLTADAAPGTLQQAQVTTSATAGNPTTIAIPDTARGVRIFPFGNDVRFAIDADPAAIGAEFAAGAHAIADQWETRLLAEGTGRVLHLASTAASVVVKLDTF